MAPWKWDRVFQAGKDEFERDTNSYGTCASDNGTLATLFGIFLCIVNVIPIVLANYQSYRSRELPSEFNESRYLTISMVSLLEAFAIGLPLVLVAVDPTAVFLTRAVILCVSCLAILLPMFVPKCINRDRPAPPARRVSVADTIRVPDNTNTS